MSILLDAVKKALDEGRIMLPVKPGEKATRFPKWSDEHVRATLEDFGENDNAAERLDSAVDIDLDCPEARSAAPVLLLKTDRRHGRPSLPHPSHYLRRESVRCEPDWRLTCHPILRRAARTRRAFADDHVLTRLGK